MFTQLHAKKGIKLFCERYIAATIKEFKQVDECSIPGKMVFIPLNPDELTDAESRKSLEVLNLIEEERNDIIKRITCANRSKQNIYLKQG